MEKLSKTTTESFFVKLSKLPLGYAALLVAFTGVLLGWAILQSFDVIIMILKEIESTENEFVNAGVLVANFGKFGVVLAFIGLFVMWVIYGLICFLLMKLFGKEVRFENVLSVSAFRYVSLSIFLSFFIFWLKNITPSEIDQIINVFRSASYTDDFVWVLSSLSIFSFIVVAFFLIEVVFMSLFMGALFRYGFELKLWQAIIIVVAFLALNFVFGG